MIGIDSISIGINPNLIDFGGFVLSWHGFLTFVAVATSVFLVTRWGSRAGLNADSIYSVAVWCIVGGVIGSRLLHVVDFWGEIYRHDLAFRVDEIGCRHPCPCASNIIRRWLSSEQSVPRKTEI